MEQEEVKVVLSVILEAEKLTGTQRSGLKASETVECVDLFFCLQLNQTFQNWTHTVYVDSIR